MFASWKPATVQENLMSTATMDTSYTAKSLLTNTTPLFAVVIKMPNRYLNLVHPVLTTPKQPKLNANGDPMMTRAGKPMEGFIEDIDQLLLKPVTSWATPSDAYSKLCTEEQKIVNAIKRCLNDFNSSLWLENGETAKDGLPHLHVLMARKRAGKDLSGSPSTQFYNVSVARTLKKIMNEFGGIMKCQVVRNVRGVFEYMLGEDKLFMGANNTPMLQLVKLTRKTPPEQLPVLEETLGGIVEESMTTATGQTTFSAWAPFGTFQTALAKRSADVAGLVDEIDDEGNPVSSQTKRQRTCADATDDNDDLESLWYEKPVSKSNLTTTKTGGVVVKIDEIVNLMFTKGYKDRQELKRKQHLLQGDERILVTSAIVSQRKDFWDIVETQLKNMTPIVSPKEWLINSTDFTTDGETTMTEEETADLFLRWCDEQKIETDEILAALACLIAGDLPKRRMLFLQGESNSGKSFWLSNILPRITPACRSVSSLNTDFGLMNLRDATHCLLEECIVSPQNHERLKQIGGGQPTAIAVKYQDDVTVTITGTIVISQTPIWTGHKQELELLQAYTNRSCGFWVALEKSSVLADHEQDRGNCLPNPNWFAKAVKHIWSLDNYQQYMSCESPEDNRPLIEHINDFLGLEGSIQSEVM